MKKKPLIHNICFAIVILIVTMNIHVLASSVNQVTSITLNKSQDTLSVGEIDTLTATIVPLGSANQGIIWTSSDPTVVNVLNGTIQALKQGAATIMAVSSYDNSIMAYCVVIANNSKTTISLDKTSANLFVGQTDTITATLLPTPTTSSNILWSSSDPTTVSVFNGRITGLKIGSTVITATTSDGIQTASCYVEVTAPVMSILLNKTTDYLKVGGNDTLTATIIPPTSASNTINWTSSDPSIVQVHNGVLIALKEGISTISAATSDGGTTATCNVIVGNPVIPTNSITLNKITDLLMLGVTDTLTASVLPANASNKNVQWTSSNPNVVTVNNGLLTPVSAGQAVIIVSSIDGYSNTVCDITVTAPSPVVNPVNTIRLGGLDRYETAVDISKQGWNATSNYAVLATAQDYPDALSAAPLAKKYNAPILLTDKALIPQNVLSEIKRLNVKNVFIVGGTGVVSQNVESQLKALNITIERLGGADRYETSVKIAEEVGTTTGKLIVANGYEWEEALSVSAIAAKAGIPIILSDKDTLSSTAKSFISNNNFSETYILGDTDLISNNVANYFLNKQRIIGSNSYERNVNILKNFESSIDFTNICVSTGKDFPDALTGSALAAALSTGVILVDPDNYNEMTAQYITQKLPQVKNVYIFGGQGALSDSVIDNLFR